MKKINGKDFKGMIASGAANLENNEKEINTLNVFPVPDGDTGTNMSMTFTNGNKEAASVMSDDIGVVAKSLSKGLLMGARGNSGVILSQIFRGFAKYTAGKESLNAFEISEAFLEGARVAYKAIMKPVEGTILTVIREAAWYANHDFKDNKNITVEEYFENLLRYADDSLVHTPDLLPALQEAGVVDSGGAGLLKILEGFKAYLDGNPVVKKSCAAVELTQEAAKEDYKGYSVDLRVKLNPEYATKKFDLEVVASRLNKEADNLKYSSDKDVLEVSVNTLKPGEILNICQRYGEFISVKIENPALKDYRKVKESKKYGIIAVAAGTGITDLFYELGVDIVVSGGQTMNPSTQDFMEKIEELDNCETIFIFPNNSNIVLAAEQAKIIANKDIVVIPSKSIQAGLSALMLFNPDADKDDIEAEMNDVIRNVKVAQITYAVKNTSFDGVEVKEGDFISLVDKTILDSSDNLKDVLIKTADKLIENKTKELMTIITGEGSDPAITEELVKHIEDNSDFEVQLFDGGQPVYSYLFGLE